MQKKTWGTVKLAIHGYILKAMGGIADLMQSTASIIADYREGEIARPDAAHVEKWLTQFDQPVRESLLTELNHVRHTLQKKALSNFSQR